MSEQAPKYYPRTHKPILAKNPVTNSLKRAYEQQQLAAATATTRSGILPNRNRGLYTKPLADDYVPNELSQRTDEMIVRFFLNNGLTYEAVEDQSLISFVRVLGGQVALPTAAVMEACAERLAFPSKPYFNFHKAIGPLTATVDTYRNNDEIFLAYSIHYFDDYAQRKNVVFLKKLILCEIDGESVMTCVRRAINNFNYGNVKFTNIVVPNEDLARLMFQTDSVANTYICSFTYLTRFVEDVLRIDQFGGGLSSLRGFILFVRRHADLYSKFRRLQLSKNGDLDLPCLDHSRWTSTTTFLTKCLLLHETFADFAQRWRLTTYISDEVFTKLSYLQRLLTHVQRLARELAQPESTSSLVVPTIVAIKSFIESKSVGFAFEKEITAMFTKHLQPLISGYEGRRYDYACLLDPRYGYRPTIYTVEQWVMIERALKEEFFKEDVVVNEKTNETVVLKPFAKHVRMQKIEDELSLYRQTLGTQRPNVLVNPFVWWGNRMTDMVNLFPKARELLSPPAVSTDTEIYFGKNGKFGHVCARMSYQQLENALAVASQQETFKGRGFLCDNFIAPILSSSLHPLKVITDQNQKPARMPITTNTEMPANKNDPDEYLESQMMQPPPGKVVISRVPHKSTLLSSSQPAAQPTAKSSTSTQPPEKKIKIEVEEPTETEDSKESLKLIKNDNNKEIKTEVTNEEPPAEKIVEVKEEVVDEEYEEKKPSLLDSQKATNVTVVGKPKTTASTIKIPVRSARKSTAATNPTSASGSSSTATNPYAKVFKTNQSSRVATVQQSPAKLKLPVSAEEDITAEEEIEETTADGTKKKVTNRRCNICLCVEGNELLKHVTIIHEKLIVLLGMITDGKMSVEEGRYCFTKATKVYICRRHLYESCRQLFASLHVTNPDEVFGARLDRIKNILEIVEDIKGSPMSALQFKKIFILFSEKYGKDANGDNDANEPEITMDVLLKAQKKANGEPLDGQESILPKALRAPRKQVLERDDNDDDVPIIRRIVSHRPWKARQQSPNCESRFKNPGRCAFCNFVAERSEMLRIPKSEDRRIRWYARLGEEFEKRVKAVENSFICRTHFPKNAFSSRGRLLKGMLPCTREDVYSYKLRGDRLYPIYDEKSDESRNNLIAESASSTDEGSPEPDAAMSTQEQLVANINDKVIKEEVE